MTITDTARPASGLAPSAHANPVQPPVERLYALDLLRFAAAAAVVAFHVVPMVGLVFRVNVDSYLGHTAAQAARYGWLGVPVFFVISGFVICMSSWGRSLGQFVTSRVTRLLPAYVLAVLVAAVILTISPNPAFSRPSLVQVLTNLTMLQGLVGVPHLDTVYWTLLVELKFYLLFVALVWAGLTYRRVVAFCGLWLAASLLAQASDTKLLVELFEPRWAPFFVAGIVLYLMKRFGASMLLWLMLAGSFALATRSIEVRVAEYATTSGPIRPGVALAVFAASVAVMVTIALGWTRGLRWRGLATVGALTYPLYLLHFHVVFFTLRMAHGWLPDWLLLVAALAGVVGLAYLAHRLVERPGGRWLRRGLQASFAQMAAGRR